MTDAGKRLIAAAEEAKAEFEREGGKSLAQVKAETMTDAPERVFAYPSVPNEWDSGYWDEFVGDSDAAIEYIRADLVPGWSSDMDAAPKDGTPVLVAAEDCNVGEASFIDGEWWWSSQACAVCWPVESSNGPVTHWMPLLDPPKEGK